MLSKQTKLSLLAGLSSGLLFCAFAYGTTGNALGIYLPVIPLLLIGLASGAREASNAIFCACAVILLFVSPTDSLAFAAFFAIPVFCIVREALLWRGEPNARQWYPVLLTLTHLTIIAAFFFCLFAYAAGQHETGGLQSVLPNEVSADFNDMDPKITSMMQWLTHDGSFLLFASMGWAWVLTFYALAVLANFALLSRKLTLRPSLAITPGGLPTGLLALLFLCGALAFFGHGNDRSAAETLFLLFLLPYFLCGVALVHRYSERWQARRIWLAVFYVALIFARWPILFVLGAGLYTQLAELLDKRRKLG